MELVIHPNISYFTSGGFHLSDFSIITGLNGSGKTMLLSLLANDQSLGIANNNQIELYDDNEQKITQIRYFRIGTITASFILNAQEGDTTDYRRGSTKQKNPYLVIWSYYQNVLQAKKRSTPGFERIADKLRKNVFELEFGDIEENYILSDAIPSQDPFFLQIGEIIGYYEKLKHDNAIKLARNHLYGENNGFLSQEEFIGKYGNHPNPKINQIFKTINLPYTVVSQENPQGYFSVFFKNILTGRLSQDLKMSSGEQVLLALALASFNKEIGSSPNLELLLLDEADATLHPSMIKQLIKTIEEVFINNGVKVIMTTHSPSTVALASEKATIYLLEKNPTRLTELPKNDAISRLSDGVPTLSVRIEDRRLVFVESKYDAENFELFFNKVKLLLGTEFSLNFIPSDITGDGDCNKVEDLVNKLNEVPSVYGLIDFDGKKTNKGNLVILGQGNRDGIENYILDPVVLGAYLIRKLIISKAEAGLQQSETTESIAQFDNARLQSFTDTIVAILLKDKPEQLTGPTIKSAYVNGAEVDIPAFFAQTDDHALEDFVLKRFPQLSALNNRNKLSKEILGTIIEDMPGLIPIDIFETLGLLTQK